LPFENSNAVLGGSPAPGGRGFDQVAIMTFHRRPALLVYGAAMGFLEAAVVVYLRALYYPGGFSFPLVPMDPRHVAIEAAREAATLVMILAVAWAAAESLWQVLIGFALAFGVWDLVYYAGLKVLLGWPASVLDSDVLFLIPSLWIGPVWAPALIALSMGAAAWLLWPLPYRAVSPRRWETACLVAAGVVLLATFLVPPARAGVTALDSGSPLGEQAYPWWAWIAGEGSAVVIAWRWWRRGRTAV
jgi:hypothetical protein